MKQSSMIIVLATLLFLTSCDSDNESGKSHQLGESRLVETSAIVDKAQSTFRFNRLDTAGARVGLWVDTSGVVLVRNFVSGTLNGPVVTTDIRTGVVLLSGRYRIGVRVGSWFHYSHDGTVQLKETIINADTSMVVGDVETVESRMCYSKLTFYGADGKIEREGFALYKDDVELFYYAVGDWIQRDSSTGEVKTIRYKEPRLF